MKATIKKPKRLVRRKPSATLTKALTPMPAANAPVIELVPSLLKIGRVLVPVDFSDCSLKALHYAVRFAEQFGSKLILTHVVELYPGDYVFGLKDAIDSNQWRFEQARAQLERTCESLAWPRTVRTERVVLFGKPFHQICDAAKERSIDLIIIATHGRTGLQRLQLGSTAERVVRHAPCPVLVVREWEKEFA
ncbi:MAG: universal stress protein [Verrucomicrobiales bacterium]|nr:universal stress protein [Verrucomicrobiales bacterium]